MFKKTALAASIALVTAGTATAATWNSTIPATTKVIHTLQGIEDVVLATGVANTNAMMVLGAEYAANDTITFTNTVAKATNANWPVSLVTATDSGEATRSTKAANFSLGTTTIATSAASTYAIGDRFTIAGDTTVYRVTAAGGSATPLNITPGLKKALTAGAGALLMTDVTSVVNLGLVSSTDTAATYRVTTVSGLGSHVNAQFVGPNLNLSPAGLTTAGENTISVASATGTGLAMDANSTALTTASTVEQFTLTAPVKLDGIVDVENDKKSFTTTTTTSANSGALNTREMLGYMLGNAAGTAGAKTTNGTTSGAVTAVVATATASVLEIDADWSFLDNNTAAGLTVGNTQSAGIINTVANNDTSIGTDGVDSDGNLQVTFVAGNGSLSWGADATTSELVITSDQSGVLPIQSYTANHTFTYTSSTTTGNTKALSVAAGSWTLNGASVTAYGVPWSAATQKFLWVGNSGTTDAAVEASVEYGGTTYGPYAVGTVAAKSQGKISAALDTALSTAGVDTSAWSRANVTMTSSVKAGNIVVNASYKHIADADRLAIPTSDDIDGTTK